MNIDLNCDMGESYGNYTIGNDDEIMPFISSCNIACGFHGGDPLHIEKTLVNARKYHLRVGAHPGYPDLNGFGRRAMQLSKEELRTNIKYQVAALIGMAESVGISISYVKPHGALYNRMADDDHESGIVIRAIMEVKTSLAIMGMAASATQEMAQTLGVPFIAEAFADRRYDENGRLLSRQDSNSIMLDPSEAAQQVLSIINHGQIKTNTGKLISVKADSICVHGDHVNAVAILKKIHENFDHIYWMDRK